MLVASSLLGVSAPQATADVTKYSGGALGQVSNAGAKRPNVVMSEDGKVAVTIYSYASGAVYANAAAIQTAPVLGQEKSTAHWGAEQLLGTGTDTGTVFNGLPEVAMNGDGTLVTAAWLSNNGGVVVSSARVDYDPGAPTTAPTLTWSAATVVNAPVASPATAVNLATTPDGATVALVWEDSALGVQSLVGAISHASGSAPTATWGAVAAVTAATSVSLESLDVAPRIGTSGLAATWVSGGAVNLVNAQVVGGATRTITWGTTATVAASQGVRPRIVAAADASRAMVAWVRDLGTGKAQVLARAATFASDTWTLGSTSTLTDADETYATGKVAVEIAGSADGTRVSALWTTWTGVANGHLKSRSGDVAVLVSPSWGAAPRTVSTESGTQAVDPHLVSSADGTRITAMWGSGTKVYRDSAPVVSLRPYWSLGAQSWSPGSFPRNAMTPNGLQALRAWSQGDSFKLGGGPEALTWDTAAPVVSGPTAASISYAASTFEDRKVAQYTFANSEVSLEWSIKAGVGDAAKFDVAASGIERGTLSMKSGQTSTAGTFNVTIVGTDQSGNSAEYAVTVTVAYSIRYGTNSATGGTVPTTAFLGATPLVVADNSGNLVKTGYTFGGWYTNTNGTGGTAYAPGDSYSTAANLTLYPKWVPGTYTITYDTNTATSGTAPDPGSYTTLQSQYTVAGNTGSMALDGKYFAGWSTTANGTVTNAPGSMMAPTANVTLYAVWLTPVTYTITFDSNTATSGTAPDPGSYTTGGPAYVLPGNTGSMTKTDKVFSGWSTVAGAVVGTAPGSNYTPTANVTLYAIWRNPETYTVTYNPNGASGTAPTSSSYTTGGAAVTLPDAGSLAKTGFTFGGWATAWNGAAISGTYTPTSNSTLYALWTANVAASSDSSLRALAVVEGATSRTLDASASGRTGQSVTVPNATTTVTVNAELGSGTATWQYRMAGGSWVTLSGTTASIPVALTVGTTAVEVKVLAQDGQTTSTWAFNVIREAETTGGTGGGSTGGNTGGGTSGGDNTTPVPVPADVTAPVITAPTKTDVVVGKDRGVAKLEANEGSTWAIHGGKDKSRFTIDGNGNLSFADDAETGSYTVEVAATDGAGNKTVKTITINVVNPAKSIVFEPQPQSGTPASPEAPRNFSVKGLPETAVLVSPVSLPAGVKELVITGGEVKVIPSPAFSGKLVIDLQVEFANGTSTVQLPVTVDPASVPAATSGPASSKRTNVTWTSVANAVAYDVVLDGKVICTGSATTCAVPALLGPNAKLEVVSLGNDGTKSSAVVPVYLTGKPVTAAKVTFAANSATLTKAAKAALSTMVKLVKQQGFTRIVLEGHTDGQGGSTNAAALSAKRAAVVADYLKRSLKVSITTKAAGNTKPIASNTTAAGQAANRRVEALVA